MAAETCDPLTWPVCFTNLNNRAKWLIVIRFAKFYLLASLTDDAHLLSDCRVASLLAQGHLGSNTESPPPSPKLKILLYIDVTQYAKYYKA